MKYRIIDGINFKNLCDDGKELNFNEFYDFLMSNKLSCTKINMELEKEKNNEKSEDNVNKEETEELLKIEA